jgi:ribosomal protein S18 acetylase RimI-like enzyme
MEMKKNCLKCSIHLLEDGNAFICSYECTYCTECFLHLNAVCPNCSGELLARPKRGPKSNGIQILPFATEFIEDLVRLFDEYRQFYQQTSDTHNVRKFLEARLKNKESVIFMALHSGKPAGFMQLYPTYSSIGISKVWILNDLYIENDHRRFGIGRKLAEYAIQFARETGASKLVLETADDNIQAQGLYEKLGFLQETGMHHYSYRL